jgi:uncharacterized protein DUF4430
VIRRVVPLLLGLLLLAGCGEERGGHGSAQLWVTRDRGAHVLRVETVPAGLTAMQALDRVAEVDTRYGGRFVQSIDGLEGAAHRQRDWFWFVNGIEGDRSAAEYRLRPGDVEWWDYRSWRGKQISHPVVVGAFPEPFLHGYDGKVRPAVVLGTGRAARELARVVRGTVGGDPRGANVIEVATGSPVFRGMRRDDGSVRFLIGRRDALRLAADPKLARFRFEGLP